VKAGSPQNTTPDVEHADVEHINIETAPGVELDTNQKILVESILGASTYRNIYNHNY
jgi:hypothetical protein